MARRESIYIDGFSHENPIPPGCRIGNLLFTGVLHGGGNGADPASFPADFAGQCERMFAAVAAVLAAAGGSLDDVAKFEIQLGDPADRPALNDQWRALFPDPDSRPARMVGFGTNRPHIRVQCEVVAVLGDAATGGTHG
ncbi:RidA family protein [Amycolatopsis jiangsuensis]|uniref:2-iminobutanoate/2-iminopropanoate deaminase n=1 Tax=Amycolatopsis jiangsuensis TaxID=1181879 RepID=A0A840J772_9PSEU|nr:RidA family protein [Amycolatopsis jiangsuensis]MBB4689274.1 2-iminobutanoate/2-iminopropanoate deaminase [Amycolatopsis jiangsuensis]